MNEELEHKGPPVPEISVEPARTEDETLDEIIKGLAGEGGQVQIARVSPSWCAGHLDVWPLDNGLNLNDIRDVYGGRRFSLKFQRADGTYKCTRTIRIAGDPLVDGRPLQPGPTYEKGGQVIVQPAPANDATEKILEALQQQQQQNQELLQRMIDQKQEKSDPLASMMAMLDFMTKLQDYQHKLGGGQEPSELGQIVGVFSDMMNQRQQATQNREPQRITVPAAEAPQSSTQAAPAAQGAPSPAPAPAATVGDSGAPGDDDDDDDLTIADELVELGPQETANVLGEVLSRWTPEQQRQAFEALMGPPAPAPQQTVDNNPPSVDDSRSGESSGG